MEPQPRPSVHWVLASSRQARSRARPSRVIRARAFFAYRLIVHSSIAPALITFEIESTVDIATRSQIAGLIATNTTVSRAGLQTSPAKVEACGEGGLSGAPLRKRADEVVALIYRLTRGSLPIIGVGGVFTAADAWEKICAGGSLIQLFTANGPDVVRQIVAKGGRVFLDLKFHDIPNTVAAAASQAASLGVSILNLHALGGAEMMKRAVAAVEETATSEGLTKPKVIAVTLLTSLDVATLGEIGIEREPGLLVTNLARAAQACGLDGVVASAHEIGIIRGAVRNPDFLIVT